jgi:hypothetical protein
MKDFAGHWEFDIRRDGLLRHYLSADVVGLGMSWGENCIIGQGIWPRFGHNFKLFSLILSPERQVTGGTFYNANEPIAVMIGVACPEKVDEPEAWPTLQLAAPAPEKLHGKTYRYNLQGECFAETEYQPIQAHIRKDYSCYSESFHFTSKSGIESQVIVDDKTLVEIRRYYEASVLTGLDLSWAYALKTFEPNQSGNMR